MKQDKINSKIGLLITTAAAILLIVSATTGNIGSALALSGQERYDVGHHEGAMKGGYDEQVGIYNDDCQRFDNSITHTQAYCNGYHDGYAANWNIYKVRNLHTINIQSSQSINQRSTVNCFLAICNNHVRQGASQDSSINAQN